MARFAYQARDGGGSLSSGAITAADQDEAGRLLRREGKFIVKLTAVQDQSEEAESGDVTLHARRVRRSEVIMFANQMAVMIETGVPISEAIECLTEQATSPHFKAVLRQIADHVQSGGEFSAALKQYPKVFPVVMTSLIRAGEASGTMGSMLDRIARYLTKEQQTRKKVKGAVSYPIFMMLMAVGVTVFLLAFVLPRFAAIYQQRDATLPAPTRLLMAVSGGLTNHWYFWLAGAVGTAIGAFLFARTPAGRRCFDWIKLNGPVIKTLFTQLYVSRACQTMGTMTNAGVSMLDMIQIVREVTNNTYYADLWDEVDEKLRQGSQLSETLFATPLVPRAVAQMIHSGEKAGRLGPTLARIAEFTEEEFDTAVKTTTQFIEPAMVCTMGLIIGFVAISLLLPIFSVGRVVAGG